LSERGELELSREEMIAVVDALLDAGYLVPVRARPYKQAKADMTLYALDTKSRQVRNILEAAEPAGQSASR
ncbi:hypothetical protein WAJ09_23510, partial [Acinetobacter baumannii]